MDYLIRFGDYYTIVKANNKKQVENFMRINYTLNPDDYGVVEASDNDIKFVVNAGGRIHIADERLSKYKEVSEN